MSKDLYIYQNKYTLCKGGSLQYFSYFVNRRGKFTGKEGVEYERRANKYEKAAKFGRVELSSSAIWKKLEKSSKYTAIRRRGPA